MIEYIKFWLAEYVVGGMLFISFLILFMGFVYWMENRK